MNARELAQARNAVTRARLNKPKPEATPRPIEQDADVRKAYAWADETLTQIYPNRIGHCVYCGTQTVRKGWPRTCPGHSDLPKYDPAFQAELVLRGVA